MSRIIAISVVLAVSAIAFHGLLSLSRVPAALVVARCGVTA